MELSAYKMVAERMKEVGSELKSCRLCPRACGVDRWSGEKGYCGLDARAVCFREMMHEREERELVPSHQVYFAGCNLRCEFCTVGEWNEGAGSVKGMSVEELASREVKRQAGSYRAAEHPA
jgi:putative pyruvate formate lyase activating enzyme